MIKFNVKVSIDKDRIGDRLDAFKAKLYPAIKQQIYKGAMKYTPYLDGNLQDSADPSAHDPTPYLVYNIEYAHYQYYANGLAKLNPPQDFPNRYRLEHPLAQCLWVQTYIDAGGRADIQNICKNAGTLLRF